LGESNHSSHVRWAGNLAGSTLDLNMKRFFKKYKLTFWDYVAFASCLLFAIAGSLVSVNRFWQYEVFYYDFGIFDQAIWSVSRFEAPIIEHLVVGGKWIFADHFNPSIFLLSPLYWLTDQQEIILVAQASIVALSGLVLYLIGKHVLKNKFYAVSILTCYFLFVGLQNAVITDFHEVTVATLPFTLTFLALIKKKYRLFLLFFIITLGFKESNFILGFGIGIALFFLDKSKWKLAIFTCLLSLAWGYLAIQFIIPYFSGGIYQYVAHMQFNPIQIAATFFDSQTKINTMTNSFLSFGFLPIFSYQFWFLIFQDFLTRFYSPLWVTRWGLGLHYSALLGAIFGISSIYSLKLLQKIIKKKLVIDLIAIVLILNAVYVYHFRLHGPFGLSYNIVFYAHSKDFEFLDKIVELIPANASVMTQNNLASHFTHQKVMLLRDACNTCKDEHYQMIRPQMDYIVIDSRPGQNPNNLFPVGKIEKIVKSLERDKNYKAIYKTDFQVVYKKR